MDRIFFSTAEDRNIYFSSLKKISGLSWCLLAKEIKISNRQLTDWRKGVYSLPKSYAELFEIKFELRLPKDVFIKEDKWHLQEAAKAGGRKRIELYGSPGTPEGRRKGGINSINTHILNNTGFNVSKPILVPNKNEDLAEVIGAIMGDGGMSTMQIQITLNFFTDKEYACYLKNLLEKLFGVSVSLIEREKNSTVVLLISSKKAVSFLHKNGLLIGNKIKQNIDFPGWINQRKAWQRACLRGLFDTDGCTYIDHHHYKTKQYGNIAVAITSYSASLLQSIYKALDNLNFHPTITSKNTVLLRREKEVYRFFREIKPSNKRHFKKLKEFLEEYRSGRNGAVSKAVVA